MPDDPAPTRTPLPATSVGSHLGAFGWSEWGLLAGIALIWGSSFLWIDIGLEAFKPGVIAMARIALGTATVGLFRRARVPLAPEDRRRVAVLGLVWIAIPLILFPVAQQWIDSSVAGMLNGGVPILTAAFAAVLLARLPGWRQLLGIGVGFVGITAIFLPELRDSTATALGASLVLIAVVLYALSTNLIVPLQQRYGALPLLFRAQLAALVVLIPVGLVQIPGSTWAWNSALAMIPLGLLSTGLAFVLMATLVGRTGGPRGSIAIYFVPIVAIALGVIFLDEMVGPLALIGTGLVVLGAWITSRPEV
ncbi:MAG: DMT family transporter [Acidimicrobiia bacterium]|nr:MAG: DMT family transporter [Acidimicrobiia bacterium]